MEGKRPGGDKESREKEEEDRKRLFMDQTTNRFSEATR